MNEDENRGKYGPRPHAALPGLPRGYAGTTKAVCLSVDLPALYLYVRERPKELPWISTDR
ncbi:hypothetical protein E2C01_037923 [Portunus trituberculatus]|uniref:Uncharacterized protein n=1 Tax=Portunus trituberculatus TaxID=210409 RepID=A0A5B7FIH7_PORTR|nr:hypothetical protein [Portunus trituberculatus]